jgi:hypothetical protein
MSSLILFIVVSSRAFYPAIRFRPLLKKPRREARKGLEELYTDRHAATCDRNLYQNGMQAACHA